VFLKILKQVFFVKFFYYKLYIKISIGSQNHAVSCLVQDLLHRFGCTLTKRNKRSRL